MAKTMRMMQLRLIFLSALSMLVTGQSSKPYDYYLLQLTWPTTFCANNRCTMRPPNHFVIHGNWPNRYDRRMVAYCSTSEDDFSQLRSIGDQLAEYWPALKSDDHENFWGYQWKKHGSCATQTEALFGIRNFFQTTLNMFFKLNLDETLTRIGSSSNHFATGRFLDALTRHYNVAPWIKCRRMSPRLSYLENISFCYDKALNLIDCPQRLQCDSEFVVPIPSNN